VGVGWELGGGGVGVGSRVPGKWVSGNVVVVVLGLGLEFRKGGECHESRRAVTHTKTNA
jgi:hypothetical protein